MRQVKTKTQPQEMQASAPSFSVVRDGASHRFVVVLIDKAWAQMPQESAGEFYSRLLDEFNANKTLNEAKALLEEHRDEILADDYVDPILYESGFFKDKVQHDDFMSRVMANFEKKQAATSSTK